MKSERGISTAAIVLIVAIITGVVVGSVVYYAAKPAEIEKPKEKTYFIGLAAHAVRCTWEDLYVKAFNWYARDISKKNPNLEIRTTWTQAGYDTATQITQAKRLIDQGIDGLVISPWDVEALRTVMDYAKEHDVPVVATNTTVNSSYPIMFVGYGAYDGCKELGERIVNYLRDNVEPIGEVKGTVIEARTGPGTSEDIMRGGGFHAAVDEYEDIEVIQVIAHSEREEAKTKITDVLRARGGEVNAVFAQNGSMGLGSDDAIKGLGYDPKDYYIATVDAFPAIIDEILEGNIDVGLDQPPAFYNPIAMHYLIGYLENGEEALPDYGEEITSDELTIRTGIKHSGVDPWKGPIWAPGKIKHMTDYSEVITNDYRWFRTNAVFVTKKNANEPYLWGNFPLPGWKNGNYLAF